MKTGDAKGTNMTNENRIELMKRAMRMLDDAGILLTEATRDHYKATYKHTYPNLTDKNGNPMEIDIDGIGNKPICVELMEVGRTARKNAKLIKQAIA